MAEAHRDATSRAEPLEFQQLYEDHAAFVHLLLKRLLGAAGDADDLLQEVFLIASRKLSSFTYGSPRAWLSQIAIRLASNARRLQRVRRAIGLKNPSEPLVDTRTPETVAQAREVTREVYAVLDSLSEKRRTVFVLYEMQGLSCPEMAEFLGCSLQTVYMRLHHARREFVARFNAARAQRERNGGGHE